MDDEHVLAFIETVDRAHLDTIGVLALDAFVVDDVGHAFPSRSEPMPAPALSVAVRSLSGVACAAQCEKR
jgi:hypothetical protein